MSYEESRQLLGDPERGGEPRRTLVWITISLVIVVGVLGVLGAWGVQRVNASRVEAEAARADAVAARTTAIAERELPTRLDYAERAWDYYTGTNALTRDMSVNRKGLEKVVVTQKQAGLLPQEAPSEATAYVVDDYLRAARAVG